MFFSHYFILLIRYRDTTIFIFIFCGRDKRRVTAIVWDSNGWLEFSKRLSCFGMSFKWPSTEKEAMSVTMADMEEMLRGGDPWRRFPEF